MLQIRKAASQPAKQPFSSLVASKQASKHAKNETSQEAKSLNQIVISVSSSIPRGGRYDVTPQGTTSTRRRRRRRHFSKTLAACVRARRFVIGGMTFLSGEHSNVRTRKYIICEFKHILKAIQIGVLSFSWSVVFSTYLRNLN